MKSSLLHFGKYYKEKTEVVKLSFFCFCTYGIKSSLVFPDPMKHNRSSALSPSRLGTHEEKGDVKYDLEYLLPFLIQLKHQAFLATL